MTAPPRHTAALTGLPRRGVAITRPSARQFLIAIALIFGLIAPFVLSGFVVFQLTLVMVYGLAILGLNLLTGFNGQFSLGHGAFYGIGAYTAAILMDKADFAYFWTLPCAGAVCFIVGFLFGFPALRLQGLYLALATFALATAMPQILKFSALESLTGGVQGIVILKPDPPTGLPLDADQWLYFFTLVVLLAMFAGAANLVKSRTGRAIIAIRDHPVAAAAMGINTALFKTMTFGVSAFYTGVAGALGAIAIQFVAPDSFTFLLSVSLLVGLVVGGVGSIPGSLFGGVFVLFVPNLAERISTGLAGAIYGIMLLLVIFIMPSGVAGLGRLVAGRAVKERGTPKMTPTIRGLLFAIAAVGMAAATAPAEAQKKYDPGATDTEIKIGHTNPYSGPASSYGVIGKVETAFFNMINEQGGIGGRKITFLSYDDGYSPPKTVEQVRKLVESDGVLLLFNTLGTPTNTAIQKYLNQKKVPQLFVATGATKWGDPKHFPWTMGFQTNYQSEARIYASYILDHHPNGKIAILYQNDDYGKDYVEGLKDGLGEKAKSMIVAETPYETTDPTVDSQVVNLKASGADIFFDVTTPKFAAQAIKKAAELDWKPVHFLNSVSNSVGGVLQQAGFSNAKGTLSSAYFKEPSDPQWRDDKAYQDWVAFMDKYYPEGDKTNGFTVYAYTVPQALVKVLKQCGDNLSRENIMKEAANLHDLKLPMLLPGITVNTSPTDFYPVKQMQMEHFNGERWELFGPVIRGEIHD
jgi:branched-chain amino acid transport system substrate-binding protein